MVRMKTFSDNFQITQEASSTRVEKSTRDERLTMQGQIED